MQPNNQSYMQIYIWEICLRTVETDLHIDIIVVYAHRNEDFSSFSRTK